MTRRVLLLSNLLLASSAADTEDLRQMEKRVFAAINNQRGGQGVAALIWLDSVAAAARSQSTRMMELGFFAHTDPERGDLAARLTAAAIAWKRCGENIFTEHGYIEPVWASVVEWMHSPGHRENLLQPEFTHSGVGVARSADGAYFMSQIFITLPPSAPVTRRRSRGAVPPRL